MTPLKLRIFYFVGSWNVTKLWRESLSHNKDGGLVVFMDFLFNGCSFKTPSFRNATAPQGARIWDRFILCIISMWYVCITVYITYSFRLNMRQCVPSPTWIRNNTMLSWSYFEVEGATHSSHTGGMIPTSKPRMSKMPNYVEHNIFSAFTGSKKQMSIPNRNIWFKDLPGVMNRHFQKCPVVRYQLNLPPSRPFGAERSIHSRHG